MPLAFLDEDHKTIVRLSSPSRADEYPNGTISYVAKHEAAKKTSLYLLVNISEDPDVLVLQQQGHPKRQGVKKLSPLFDEYLSRYPSAKKLKTPDRIVIDDPSDVLLLRLTNQDKFF